MLLCRSFLGIKNVLNNKELKTGCISTQKKIANQLQCLCVRILTFIPFIILQKKCCLTDKNSRKEYDHRNVLMLVMTHVQVKHYAVRYKIERQIICMKSAF